MSDNGDIYQNCQTSCPMCMRQCDKQTDINGRHSGEHHCSTHGNYQ